MDSEGSLSQALEGIFIIASFSWDSFSNNVGLLFRDDDCVLLLVLTLGELSGFLGMFDRTMVPDNQPCRPDSENLKSLACCKVIIETQTHQGGLC